MVAILLCAAALPAQTTPEPTPSPFSEKTAMGGWLSEDITGANYVTLLWPNGVAIGFWTDTPAHIVDRGGWQMEDGKAVISWGNGTSDVLERRNDTNALRHTYPKGQDTTTGTPETVRALRIPAALIGKHASQFSNDSAAPAKKATDAEIALASSPYAGFWQAAGPSGTWTFQLLRDGTARSLDRKRKGRETTAVETGTWTESNGEARITWNGRDLDRLRAIQDGLRLTEHRRDFETHPLTTSKVVRMDAADAKMLFEGDIFENYNNERFIGTIITGAADGGMQVIDTERFGAATLRRPGKEPLKGSWKTLSNGILMNWTDGTAATIRFYANANATDDRRTEELAEFAEFAKGTRIFEMPAFITRRIIGSPSPEAVGRALGTAQPAPRQQPQAEPAAGTKATP